MPFCLASLHIWFGLVHPCFHKEPHVSQTTPTGSLSQLKALGLVDVGFGEQKSSDFSG